MEMKTIKIAIIGYGKRGRIYADYAFNNPNQFKVVAIVETNEEKLDIAKKHNCPLFTDYKEFLKANVNADIVAIATQDKDHKEHALACIEKGYDLLLEKPIATNLEDCMEIFKASQKYQSKVIVCHVLRYTPFYSKIKEILKANTIGDIVSIEASENVGYYHQAHSYVRGPWRNTKESCPMIVAKCCHDMDIIRWLIDKECKEISSFGELSFFKEENAPQGSTKYCSDCKLDCPFKAQRIYRDTEWMRGYFTTHDDNEKQALKDLIHSQYDRCVFRCDNDVVDHQVSIMRFEDGITSTHSMTAFSKEIYRDIKIHGTKAELYGVMEKSLIEIRPYGKDSYIIDLSEANTTGNHSGGDNALMNNLYLERNGVVNDSMTYLDVSIESHLMAFGAEESRLTHKVIKIKK